MQHEFFYFCSRASGKAQPSAEFSMIFYVVVEHFEEMMFASVLLRDFRQKCFQENF